METDIEAILIAFIREHCLPRKLQTTLGLEDHLFETATIDSAGLIHFLGYIEERFGIDIPDEDLIPEKFTTIASIAEYIRGRLGEPAVIEER
jgi:acyl carrier protein